MMGDLERSAIASIRDTARVLAGELSSLVEDLSVILDTEEVELPEPEPVPGPARGSLLPVDEVRTWNRPEMGIDPTVSDVAKLRALFPTLRATPSGMSAGWVDSSSSLRLVADGSIVVVLDKGRRTEDPNSGGSSWVNACIPLARPVAAAEIFYTIEFGAGGYPFGWGESMKFPGLQRWVEGRTPGGGEVTARNWSVRPCSADWNKDGKSVRFGPYVYGQHRGELPDLYHAEDYPSAGHPKSVGTLRWSAPVVPLLDKVAGRLFDVRVRIESAGPGHSRISTTVVAREGQAEVGRFESAVRMQTSSLDQPHQITHVPFVVMYGGDSLKYGPEQQVTALRLSGLKVSEI